MKLGLFMMPLHRPDRDYHTVLEEDQEAILLADKLGFDEAWVGEHLTAKTEQITSPLIFLASLANQTTSIKLGTGVLNLPHHHPAYVAGHAAMFDHLTKGRFLMGIGTGGLVSDFELFKTREVRNRGEMLIESIDMILTMWREEPPYALHGKYWNIDVTDSFSEQLGLGYMARPYQLPHPPIAISAMSPNSSSVRLAGERGWGPISANFIPPVHIATHWTQYVAGCEAAGRTPDPADWRVAQSIFVADTDEEAERHVKNPDGSMAFYYRYLRDQLVPAGLGGIFKADPSMSDDDLTLDYFLDAMMIYGSPDTVVEKLCALRERIGDFGTLLAASHDWDDKTAWQRSMTLLAEDVMPRVRHKLADQVAAE